MLEVILYVLSFVTMYLCVCSHCASKAKQSKKKGDPFFLITKFKITNKRKRKQHNTTKKEKTKVMDESLNSLKVKALGARQEVGRSCVLIQFRGWSILLDCVWDPP